MTVAVDTNILVRLVARDHEAQFRVAQKLLETEHVFIAESVLLETEWVLRAIYKLPSPEIRRTIRNILGLKNVTLADPDKIARILDWHEAGMDFADAFHLANSLHLKDFKTFDRDFVKRSKKLSSALPCKVSPI